MRWAGPGQLEGPLSLYTSSMGARTLRHISRRARVHGWAGLGAGHQARNDWASLAGGVTKRRRGVGQRADRERTVAHDDCNRRQPARVVARPPGRTGDVLFGEYAGLAKLDQLSRSQRSAAGNTTSTTKIRRTRAACGSSPPRKLAMLARGGVRHMGEAIIRTRECCEAMMCPFVCCPSSMCACVGTPVCHHHGRIADNVFWPRRGPNVPKPRPN